MITKEEIIEILNNHAGYMDRSRTEQAVHEDNFNCVVDEILIKLNQDDVSGRSEILRSFIKFVNERQFNKFQIYLDEVELFLDSNYQ